MMMQGVSQKLKHNVLIPLLTGLLIPFMGSCALFSDPPPPPQAEPEEPQNAYEMGLELVNTINTRQYEKALGQIEEYRDFPDHHNFWASTSEAYIRYCTGDYDDALDILNEIRIGPFNSDAMLLRGSIYYEMNMLGEAWQDYSTVLMERLVDKSRIRYMMLPIAVSWGAKDDIRDTQLNSTYKPPSSIYDYFLLYDLAILERDFTSAVQAIDLASDLPPSLDDPDGLYFTPVLLSLKANAFHHDGQVDRAVTIYENIIDEFPLYIKAAKELTGIALETGDPDHTQLRATELLVRSGAAGIIDEFGLTAPENETESISTSGVLLRSESAYALSVLSAVALGEGNTSLSIRFAEKAIETEPFYTGSYLQLAMSHETNGDFNSAMSAMVSGIVIAPEDDGLLQHYLMLCELYPLLVSPGYPDPDAVREDLNSRLTVRYSVFPNDPSTATEYGHFRQFRNDPACVDAFRTAYEEEPFNVHYVFYYTAAIAEFGGDNNDGDPDAAITLIEENDVPRNLQNLIYLYERLELNGSENLRRFTTWYRERTDPDGSFDPYLEQFE